MTLNIDSALLERYELLCELGRGSNSIVWKAINRSTEKLVTIKKIEDGVRFKTDAARVFKELFILTEFLAQENKNFVQPIELIRSTNKKDLYIVFEFLEINLSELSKGFRLKREQISYIIFQLVNAVKQLHSMGVTHRDLRPENILLNTKYLIKLKNFKSAKLPSNFYRNRKDKSTYQLYTGRIIYRSPEAILGACEHTTAMDMWSIGCILAELYLGQVLFPGDTILKQLEFIQNIIGEPTMEELESMKATHKSKFFQFAQSQPQSSEVEDSECERKPEEKVDLKIELDSKNSSREKLYKKYKFYLQFKGVSADAIDFLKQVLTYDPSKRMTAEEALHHPYLRRYRQLSKTYFKVKQKSQNLKDLQQVLRTEHSLYDLKTSVFYRLNVILIKHYNEIESKTSVNDNYGATKRNKKTNYQKQIQKVRFIQNHQDEPTCISGQAHRSAKKAAKVKKPVSKTQQRRWQIF